MTTTAHSIVSTEHPPRRVQAVRLPPAILTLIAIMGLAALLNFVNIDAIGDANTYYTAAVEAMLQSPANFFFVAAEPGGSVTIDKPPLGLWLQAISALFLGVNGFAVVLPQILAGIFSVSLLYWLVKRGFGTGAGLIAALMMAAVVIAPLSSFLVLNSVLVAIRSIQASNFSSPSRGPATMALVLLAIIMILAAIQLRVFRREIEF